MEHKANMEPKTTVTGVILAGGRAKRMGHQDKGLVSFRGQPLISHAISAMRPVVDSLMINANRNLEAYRQWGYPVISDQTDSFDGPLAGMLTAMLHCQTDVLLVMPCDSPLLQPAQLQRLIDSRHRHNADAAVAMADGRWQPVFLAIKPGLKTDLQAYLAAGERKVETWLARHNTIPVDFNDCPERFANVNTLEDLLGLADGGLSGG